MAYTLRGSVLTASDAAATDYFGSGVALSGNGLVMAVGANLWEGASGINLGGVYIFDWSGSAWVQRGAVLQGTGMENNDVFGASVALSYDGTILAAGANMWSESYGQKGAVYIFDWSGSAWAQRGSRITASDGAGFDNFGIAVALSDSGTILVVGAQGWEGSLSGQGGVYVYDWSGSAWGQRTILTASDAAASDGFGSGIAVNSDATVLAVGAASWHSSNYGKVYIFDWSGSVWTQRGTITASDAATNDYFGTSVALSSDGTLLAVGAWGQVRPSGQSGGAYVYHWSGSAWVEDEIILAADDGYLDYFGNSIALSGDGDVLAIGAPRWEDTTTDQGGVYIYDAPSVVAQGRISVATPLGAIVIRAYVGNPPLAHITVSSPLGSASVLCLVPSRYPHLYRLSAYISGGEDGLTDYPIQLTSFGLSKRSGETSYYSISAQYTDALLDAINARPNGIVHILRDGNRWESFNVGHPVRYDFGPNNASISLSGSRQQTALTSAALAITPAMVASESINSEGQLTLALVPGIIDPRPTDVFAWEGSSYTVTLKKFQAGASSQSLAIIATPV